MSHHAYFTARAKYSLNIFITQQPVIYVQDCIRLTISLCMHTNTYSHTALLHRRQLLTVVRPYQGFRRVIPTVHTCFRRCASLYDRNSFTLKVCIIFICILKRCLCAPYVLHVNKCTGVIYEPFSLSVVLIDMFNICATDNSKIYCCMNARYDVQ